MKKRQLIFGGLIWAIGVIVGGFAVATFFAFSIRSTVQVLSLHHRADLERRAFQAYSEEAPQVSVWALSNLADILRSQEEDSDESEAQLIRKDLVLTYARLAIVSRKAKDIQKYEENISKALDLAKQVYQDGPKTEEDLLRYVERLDRAAERSRNP